MKEFQAILTAFDDWLWGNWLLFVLLGWIHYQEDRVGADPFQE